MRYWLLLIAIPGFAGSLFEQSGFPDAAGWKAWAARDEIAPKTFVAATPSLSGRGSLAISGANNAASSGGWERVVPGVQPGRWYKLTVHYRGEHLRNEANEVICRLDWTDRAGKRAGQPDYGYRITESRGWRKVELTAPAPEMAAAAKIELYLHNAPKGTVWFDDVALEAVEKPAPRPVTITAIKWRARNTAGREDNVRRFLDLVDRSAPGKTDVILLPEGMTVVGTGKTYAEVAEPVPGPTTTALGEMARRKHAYIAAGLYERDGSAIYNTAVLVDRNGNYAGKYRKVYLPREEIEAGLTAGSDYPVFRTDFGKIGLMICWDVQYPDPARALALQGAELILLPIWGGNSTLTKARAIENSVFLATSGYDIPTMVLDPKGETLATAAGDGSAAVATVNLNERYTWEYLGDMRGRFFHEVRTDVPTPRPVLAQ